MKTCVVIPTFNEARSIAALIRQIKQLGFEVIVVDDGSKDNTASEAIAAGATVIHNIHNEGKGASLVKGFNYALNQDFDSVITMDGDGQHLPQDIATFVIAAQNSSSCIFIGNRMGEIKNMPFTRLATNRMMSRLISLISGQHIPDTQCGFRLLKKGALEKIKLSAKKYEIESEMILKVARAGFKIESVPITTVYGGQKSQINPFVDTLRFIKFLFKELWTT